jgi:hypothetical protein
MIGNARWAAAAPGWSEPPHLWCAAVGDSGEGKSPGADVIYRRVLPPMEARMMSDFPERLQEHRRQAEVAKALHDKWRDEVRAAQKKGTPPPLPPEDAGDTPEPMAPRLVQNDVTIEKVAQLLAGASPKGLLMSRNELAGWLLGMNNYNDGARGFWLESYDGKPYRQDRMKHRHPIDVPHMVVAWYGGIQPPRLAQIMREADDGLLARFCYFWPDPIPFDLSTEAPNVSLAVDAFDRLRLLEMKAPAEPGMTAGPILVPLTDNARDLLRQFAREMQERKHEAGGLMVSALGKARGLALRLSLVLEFLWWAAKDGMVPPPTQIGEAAILAAATLVGEYLMPMAERVYGDAATTQRARNTATLAKWIVKTKAKAVNVRNLQRAIRLPGLGEAHLIHEACGALIEAGWLTPPPSGGATPGRPRGTYEVRPELWEALQ